MKKLLKQPKKHNSIRIVNPGDTAVARVHPRQGIKIVLDKPSCIISNVSEEAEFEINLKSDFLFLEKQEINNKNQNVYYFQQKYDLSSWVQISEIFLGEISIDLVNNIHPNKENCRFIESTIGIYHKLYDSYSDFLTTINPDGTTIKIEPNRTLEVVVFEPSWEETDFTNEIWKVSIEDFEVEAKGVFLKNTRDASFNVKLRTKNEDNVVKFEGYPIVLRNNPPINPFLEEDIKEKFSKEISERGIPGKQTHFWFNFSEKSIKTISGIKNGNYVVSRITLNGQFTDGNDVRKTKRDFIVMLFKHGKPSGNAMPTSTLPKLLYSTNNLKREFVKHLNDKPNNSLSVLTNPSTTEQMDFHLGYEKCIVEIALPKYHWIDEPDNAIWKLKGITASANNFLEIEQLPNIEKFNIKYQRYKISRKNVSDTSESNGFLGTIEFEYLPKQHLPTGSKRLSCWMEFKEKASSIYKNTNYSSSSNGGYSCSHSHYKTGLGSYLHPKIAIVNIEEIVCLTLEQGASTKKLSEISTYNHGQGWECYYVQGFYDITPEPKKKEGSIIDNKSTLMSMNIENSTTIGQGTFKKELILHNPTHMQEVVLSVGQQLLLKLMPPESLCNKKEDKEKCRGELWAVNTISLANGKPKIASNRVLPVNSSTYCQEILITVDSETLPVHKGKIAVGAINISCSATNRVLRLFVQKEFDTSIDLVYDNTSFIKDMVMHEANGRRYLLLNNWNHGSNVSIKSSDVLFVETPNVNEEWTEDWNVQFIPESISQDIWNKLSANTRETIKQNNPWFEELPVFNDRAMMFKALDQSKSFKPLIDDIRNQTKENFIHIATLVFQVQKFQIVEDENSLVETSVKVRRDLLVYIEIDRTKVVKPVEKAKGIKGRIIPIMYPADNAHICASIGEKLSFYFAPTKCDVGRYVWLCQKYPTVLSSDGTSVVNGDDVFNFVAAEVGEGEMIFKNSTNIKKITIKILKN